MARKRKPARGARGTSAAVPLAVAAAGIGAVFFALLTRQARRGGGGHAARDLALDAPQPMAANTGTPPAGHRAPEAFRPDPTASVDPAEREALRPATLPLATRADQG